ncbi:MAG: 2,3-bisphosphoglycerate-independent phosphoglycerate mutase [Chloroflexota bacterium]|nr:2,3-bisphosphoglycerate-independent phosphoglycerate mutase [Chloroflexota bacterium]
MTVSEFAESARPRPLVLVVLDGFGIGAHPERDAIAAARMPVWRSLLERWPHCRLGASGASVGLPPGQMGNSEVGHLNLGAGRQVLQDLPRIDASITDGSFFTRHAFLDACSRARSGSGVLHLVSLIGPGGVHANDRHLVALAELASRERVRSVRVHALLDGRDTPPRSALGFVADLERRLAGAHPDARVTTIGGRYFAMDRDQRWDRTRSGYRAIVHATGAVEESAAAAIEAAYARGENDEFATPTVIDSARAAISGGEPVIICNFRADRARQLTHALAEAGFAAFDRTSPSGRPPPSDLLVVTMTEYEEGMPVEVAFPPETVSSLAAAFSRSGWRQFHVAETEKYAHVTYFLNGGVEAPFPGEDRVLIPSPSVATYDLRPEMSAAGVTDALLEAIEDDDHDFLVANYANADMVGHSGIWEATVTAVETLDDSLGRIVAALTERDAVAAAAGRAGSLLCITADHGNADEMRDPDGRPVTAHSLNPVPFLLAGNAVEGRQLDEGVLADVAPTLLEVVGISAWQGMTGRSLLTGRAR